MDILKAWDFIYIPLGISFYVILIIITKSFTLLLSTVVFGFITGSKDTQQYRNLSLYRVFFLLYDVYFVDYELKSLWSSPIVIYNTKKRESSRQLILEKIMRNIQWTETTSPRIIPYHPDFFSLFLWSWCDILLMVNCHIFDLFF